MTTYHVTPDFAPLLRSFELSDLEEHQATIYGLHRDYTIGYVNSSWFSFAQRNDAPDDLLDPEQVLGLQTVDEIAGPLRIFYQNLFTDVLARGEPHCHEYECSSPDTIRHYHMDILPLPATDSSPQGLLLINSSFIPDDPVIDGNPVESPQLDDFLAEGHLLICCSNCRRFQRRDEPRRWDWVPSFLRSPPVLISHGLCEVCLDYYYPALRKKR